MAHIGQSHKKFKSKVIELNLEKKVKNIQKHTKNTQMK